MVPSPLPRNYTHLVGTQAFNSDEFLTLAQTFGLHRRVWHEDQDDEGIANGEKTTEHEDYLVGEELTAVDMAQAICKETANLREEEKLDEP
jgi:glutathione S-transferase